MRTQKDYLELINKAVSNLEYPSQPVGLYEPIAYTLDCGGKRMRPMLLLAACEACGGDARSAMSQALGIEMFHNFTLLHDDIMDRADVRRGKPTVHCKWNDSTAILSGDAMLTMATILTADCPANKLPHLLGLFNRTAMEIYEGQQYDMNFETRNDVAVEEYLEMIRLKTSVLLGYACSAGAFIAGASNQICDSFYRFAVALGMAFQLQDDWLDTYGDSAVFGKNIGGDIRNDKKTYLLITAMDSADESQRQIIRSYVGVRSDEKVGAIKKIYEKLGVAEKCRAKIKYYLEISLNELEVIDISADAKNFFRTYAENSILRKS